VGLRRTPAHAAERAHGRVQTRRSGRGGMQATAARAWPLVRERLRRSGRSRERLRLRLFLLLPLWRLRSRLRLRLLSGLGLASADAEAWAGLAASRLGLAASAVAGGSSHHCSASSPQSAIATCLSGSPSLRPNFSTFRST
jgi:hypothetical protein